MTCFAENVLRARMDGELSAPELNNVDEHLRSCANCRTRIADIRARAESVGALLRTLADPADAESGANASMAYREFRDKVAARVAPGMRWHPWTVPAGGALAAALALVVLFSFAPARMAAQKFLDMLRVQKVVVVPVDLSALETQKSDRSPGKLLTQLISDEVVVTMKPGAPQTLPDAGVAGAAAGFSVRTLTGLGAPAKVQMEGEGAFHATLDRDRILDLLNQVGRPDIQIPETVNGATVAVHLPKMVRIDYGTCPDARRDSSIPGCLTFFQVPAPVVSVPPGLNLASLAEAGLQFAGMSAAEAHAFCQTVDWSSTLVIPVPNRESTSRTVSVDGVTGTLVESTFHGGAPGRFALIWVKNGIIYSLNGAGDSSGALAAVASIS